MWLCVCKNIFNLVKVYTCCCKIIRGSLFSGHSVYTATVRVSERSLTQLIHGPSFTGSTCSLLERVKCKPIVITRPCLNAILLLAVCRRSVFNSPWLLQVQHLRSTAGRIQRCAGLVRTNAYRASSSRV